MENKFLGEAGTRVLVDRIKNLESNLATVLIIELNQYPGDYVSDANVPTTKTFAEIFYGTKDSEYNEIQFHVKSSTNGNRYASIPVALEETTDGIFMTSTYTRSGIPETCVWDVRNVSGTAKIHAVTVHRLEEITAQEVEDKFNA